MARMKKAEVIEALRALGVECAEDEKYNDLCKLLKSKSDAPATSEKKLQIKLVNKIARRNTFLADQVRNDRDAVVLNAEIKKREHKGKIKTITTIKQMEVNKEGFYVTEFVIDLKE